MPPHHIGRISSRNNHGVVLLDIDPGGGLISRDLLAPFASVYPPFFGTDDGNLSPRLSEPDQRIPQFKNLITVFHQQNDSLSLELHIHLLAVFKINRS
jgi:hypothetical protein